MKNCLTDAFLSTIVTKDRSAVTLCGTDLPKAAGGRRAARNDKCMLVVRVGS